MCVGVHACAYRFNTHVCTAVCVYVWKIEVNSSCYYAKKKSIFECLIAGVGNTHGWELTDLPSLGSRLAPQISSSGS